MVASAGVLLTAIVAAGAGSVAAATSPTDWPSFMDGPSHHSYDGAATTITTSNISKLTQAWNWPVPASKNTGSNWLEASPIVVDGVIYVGAEDGIFYALSESTHKVLWSDHLGVDTAKGTDPCGDHGEGITATAAYAVDPVSGTPTVFVNAPSGKLYALNASTGATIWTARVDTPSPTKNNYYSWSSPLVAHGNVYVGISSDCDSPLIPGGVISFNQSTGAQVAKWIDVPNTGGEQGGSVWSSPGELADGRIVVATGNGYKNSGEPLYDDSIVELNPKTLAVASYWQIPNGEQITDGDFGASPVMWFASIKGVSTPMLGDCDKNGYFYALKQNDLSAGPVWSAKITEPYPGGDAECDSSGVYDKHHLIIGGGAPTTIGGTTYQGSVRSLNPSTGKVNWKVGLPAGVIGTPTEDGGGVVAAQTFISSSHDLGVYLLNASTGARLKFIRTGVPVFAQAEFVNSDLLVSPGGKFGLSAYTISSSSKPVPTSITPSSFAAGSAKTSVTIAGSGFAAGATVTSHTGIHVSSVSFVSSSELTADVTVASTVAAGTYNLFVHNSDGKSGECTGCITVT